MTASSARPILVGHPAPPFRADAVHGEGVITLDDFTGRAFFLGLYRGLHCPFCRRHLARLDLLRARLEPLGVTVLAIVNTPVQRARFYFRHYCAGVTIGADPGCAVHSRYAVPEIRIVEPGERTRAWPEQITIDEFLSHRINPTGELDVPVNPLQSNDVLNAKDGFRPTAEDDHVRARHGTQLVGMFLVDRAGIVRWRFVEAEATPADIGWFPTPSQVVEAASAMSR